MIEALQFEFMRNALAAGLLAAVICGIMGTLAPMAGSDWPFTAAGLFYPVRSAFPWPPPWSWPG